MATGGKCSVREPPVSGDLLLASLDVSIWQRTEGGNYAHLFNLVLWKEVARKDEAAGNVIVQGKSNWLHFITVYLQEVNGKMMLLVVDIPRGSRWN
ncbi:hypothetical protein MKW98_031703 [Papaver atlanticum]|uniref:Uncharacterized protein n=1 Tax=Papaver atlanticum TaxID=357466 RepID=A0AAD4X881_9MAGN|nr:hypothetical protein MKW98_031703 [Papaver atlanticum]